MRKFIIWLGFWGGFLGNLSKAIEPSVKDYEEAAAKSKVLDAEKLLKEKDEEENDKI